MKDFLLSERKESENRTIDLIKFCLSATIFTICLTTICFAADGNTAINTAKTLLSKAATAGGGLWAVWGIVQLGMALKDHNGPGISGAIWQIIGGAISLSRTTRKPLFQPLSGMSKSFKNGFFNNCVPKPICCRQIDNRYIFPLCLNLAFRQWLFSR